MLHSPQCKFMKWVSSCPIREVSYPPHTHTPVQPAQEPAPVQPPQEPAAVPEFPIDDLNMLIRGFDEQALRPPAPLQTLASYSNTLAGALISAAVAVPFGVGLVLRGAATLLEQLATLQQANDTALLLAIDVALVVEIFSGLRRHGFEMANNTFWNGAGKLHLARLRQVRAFNSQTKKYESNNIGCIGAGLHLCKCSCQELQEHALLLLSDGRVKAEGLGYCPCSSNESTSALCQCPRARVGSRSGECWRNQPRAPRYAACGSTSK